MSTPFKLSAAPIVAIVIAAVTAAVLFAPKKNTEHFTATGYVLAKAPEWFWPSRRYETQEWLTPYFPDQLAKPECLPYDRGNPGILNYNSSAYRFWRF